MRISEIDLQCEDLMWFAIDNLGNIMELTSAGCGNVPESVCKSRENLQKLTNYFLTIAPTITTAELLISKEDTTQCREITDFSSKGLYCFDIIDCDNPNVYSCISKPAKPLNISELPTDIQVLLTETKYNGDVSKNQQIKFTHAY